MAQITFEVQDENVLKVLKEYAATLEAVTILEEDEEPFYPFSKDESERRLEESRQQIKEGKFCTHEELKLEMRERINRKYNGV